MEVVDFLASRSKRTVPKKLRKAVLKVAGQAATGKKNPYAHTQTGYRPDLGIVVRSEWEALVLRVLTAYGIKWEYEPDIFIFPIKRGTKSYTPDIKISDGYIEIKGWFDPNSRIKLKRFKKYYPLQFQKLILIVSKYSKPAQRVIEELDIQNVLFYEDIEKIFKEQIATMRKPKI